jgi:cytochrome bd ubiquinol oxidase subunit II
VVLAVLVTIATFIVQPIIWPDFVNKPWGFIFPILAFVGLVGAGYCNFRPRDLFALFSSGLLILGLLASTAFGLYPNVLPAVNPANSLTIQNASSSAYGQTVGLVWWVIGIVLAIIYFVVAYRLFWGKITPADAEKGYGS